MGDAITPDEGWSVGFLTRPVAGGHYSLLALEVMEDERKRRENVRNEWISEEYFYLTVILGSAVIAVLGWRAFTRRNRTKSGYQELLSTARTMRRRFSSRGGGEEAIWLAETPEQGSVFDLGPDDEGSDQEDEWAKRRIRRRSS